MVDLPFLNYHSAVIIDKLRKGQPIMAEDVDKLMYGSAIYKIFSPYFRSNPSNQIVYKGGQLFPSYANATTKTRYRPNRQWSKFVYYNSHRFGNRYFKSRPYFSRRRKTRKKRFYY